MSEQRPVFVTPGWQSGRLIDVVNHLPPGTRLTASPTFTSIIDKVLDRVGIFQACDAIVTSGFKDETASVKGPSIIIYGNQVVFTLFSEEERFVNPVLRAVKSATALTEAEQLTWLQKNMATVWFGKHDVKIKVKDMATTIGKDLREAIVNIERIRAERKAISEAYRSLGPMNLEQIFEQKDNPQHD